MYVTEGARFRRAGVNAVECRVVQSQSLCEVRLNGCSGLGLR